MHKFIPILFFGVLLLGCKPNAASDSETTGTQEAKTAERQTTLTKEDGVIDPVERKSDEWFGTYSAVLPCADCRGTETTVVLHEDNTYSLSLQYLGKPDDASTTMSGRFAWNADGTTIQLMEYKDGPNQYIVGRGMLIQLDKDGKAHPTQEASKYFLMKQ